MVFVIIVIVAADWKDRPRRSSKASTALSLPIRELLFTLSDDDDAHHDYSGDVNAISKAS